MSTKSYCVNDCPEIIIMDSVDDNEIVLMNKTGKNGVIDDRINRRTGVSHAHLVIAGNMTNDIVAQCKLQPFSGFPAKRF